MKKIIFIITTVLLLTTGLQAETLNLEQAVKRALKADPRIREKERLTDVARALEQEARDSRKMTYDFNFWVGLAPDTGGGPLFEVPEGESRPKLRKDMFEIKGFTPWYNLEFMLIKPWYTFGMIENYTAAAQANVKVKQGDVQLQRGDIILDVHRAYYGHLAARDTRRLLEDVKRRLNKAIGLVEGRLKRGSGNSKQSDLFALQTVAALINRYHAEAQGMERIALEGLKTLTGIGQKKRLKVADKRLTPVDLPAASLQKLQARALKKRPERAQLEAGLDARRALVAAKKAGKKPKVYYGLGGEVRYTPEIVTEESFNTKLFDPFNYAALTPLIGIKWDWESGRQPAQVNQAQAELDALVEKSAFARQGIPFQVAEQYHYVRSFHTMVEELAKGSRAGRRWMISSYADFEAGLEEADKVMTAFQGYILAHTEYLKAVNDYNMHVVKLRHVTGELQ